MINLLAPYCRRRLSDLHFVFASGYRTAPDVAAAKENRLSLADRHILFIFVAGPSVGSLHPSRGITQCHSADAKDANERKGERSY